MKKYLTLPVLIAFGNLLAAVFSYATGHQAEAAMFFGLFVGQFGPTPHGSISKDGEP